MSDASTLTNKIIATIYQDGGFAFRASSTGIFDSKQGGYRTAPKKGVSDVLAVYHGIFIAIEVKIGMDRLSDEQIGFIKNIQNAGGYAIMTKNIDDFKTAWLSIKSAIDKR